LTPNYNYQGHGKKGWLYIFNGKAPYTIEEHSGRSTRLLDLGNQFFVTVIKQWHPNFDAYEAKIEKVVVWVRLSDLEMEHFDIFLNKKILKYNFYHT